MQRTVLVVCLLLLAGVQPLAHADEPGYLTVGELKPATNLSYQTDWQAVIQELAQTLAGTGQYRLVAADKLQELLLAAPVEAGALGPEGEPLPPVVIAADRLEGAAARMTPEDAERAAELCEAQGVVVDDAVLRGAEALGGTGLGRVQGLPGKLGDIVRDNTRDKPKVKVDLKLTVWLTDVRTGVQGPRVVGYGQAQHATSERAWKLAVERAARGVLGALVNVEGSVVRMDPGGKPRTGKSQGARVVVSLTRDDGLSPTETADGDMVGVILEVRQPDQDDPDIGLVKGEVVGYAICTEAGDRGARCAPFGLEKVGPLKGKQLNGWWDAVEPGFVVRLRLDLPRCALPKPEEPLIPGAAAKGGAAPEAAPGS